FLFICLFVVFSSSLSAHQEMTYVACPTRAWGCSTGRYSIGAGLGWSKFRERTSFVPNILVELGVLNKMALALSFGGVNSEQIYQSLQAAPSLVFGAGLELYGWQLYRGPVLKIAALKHLYREDISHQRYSSDTAISSTVGWRWRTKEYTGSFVLVVWAQEG
ncbi:MAG: hypothetical protein ACKOA8_10595, partial [Deltaproteobacteria bacterium]